MFSCSKKIQTFFLLCIFIIHVKCSKLIVQLDLMPANDFKSSKLIECLLSQPTQAAETTATATPSAAEVRKWRLLNPLPTTAATPSAQKANKYNKWSLSNGPALAAKPDIQFPTEDANQPSPHEYHPEAKKFSAHTTTTTTTTTPQPNSKLAFKQQQKFNANLYEVLAPKFNNKNLLYSPSSLQTILALLYFGAEGRTAAELQNGLELPTSPNEAAKYIQQQTSAGSQKTTEDFKFLMASKIYYKNDLTLEPSFRQAAWQYFYSDLERISFEAGAAAAERINQWVAAKTEQRIGHIIDAGSLDAETEAVLINAIYLKAKWQKEFSQSDTEKMDFYTRNDLEHAQLVKMMYLEDDFNYGDFPALDASIVELPFLDSEFSMLLVVPNQINGLAAVESRLKAENLNELLAKMAPRTLTLRMPQFKIEAELDMVEPLQQLNIHKIFSTNAELGKIFSNNPNVRISKILHKAFINVNEGGVEAAASTYSQLVPLSLPVNTLYVTADHPFMFAIRSRQAVHFIGHVIDDFQ